MEAVSCNTTTQLLASVLDDPAATPRELILADELTLALSEIDQLCTELTLLRCEIVGGGSDA